MVARSWIWFVRSVKSGARKHFGSGAKDLAVGADGDGDTLTFFKGSDATDTEFTRTGNRPLASAARVEGGIFNDRTGEPNGRRGPRSRPGSARARVHGR